MKPFSIIIGTILLSAITAGTAKAQTAATTPPAPVMVSSEFSTNINEVLKLTQAGLSDNVVIAFINNAQTSYDLKAKDILALKKIGVSQTIITTMISHDTALKQANGSNPAAYNPAVPDAVAAETAQVPAAAPVPQPTVVTNTVIVTNTTVVTPAPQVVVVQPPTPPPQIELVPVCPAPEYVWCGGHWFWNGRSYVWVGGYWAPPPSAVVSVGFYWGGRGHPHPAPHHPWR